MFRRNRRPVAVANPTPATIPLDHLPLSKKNFCLVDAQIVSADIERVKRFVVHINGIPQKPEREADMVLTFVLRTADGENLTHFKLVSTDGMPQRPWAKTGTDGLLEEVFKFFSVNSLGKLKGRFIRVLKPHGEDAICAIGDYLEDRWFTYVGDQSAREAGELFTALANRQPQFMPDQHGRLHLLRELYFCGYENARIKAATLAPAANNRMNVHLRLSDIASNSHLRPDAGGRDIVITFSTKTMEEMNTLLDKLCEVAGLPPGNFTRLNGRLVRFHGEAVGDVSFSGAEREAARHFYVKHPVLNHSIDMADYGGTKEAVGE